MILAKVCAIASSPVRKDNQKVYVNSLRFHKVERQVSVLGLIHVASSKGADENAYYTYPDGYREGVQKLLKPHKRTIVVEGDLIQLIPKSSKTLRYDFSTVDRVWKKLSDLNNGACEQPEQDQRSACFHSSEDVKGNILRFESDRDQSLEDLEAFPSQPLFCKANERTFASIDMAMTILRFFYDNPKEEKVKLLCGLYHQKQVAALLEDANLLYDKQRMFYNAASFFYKNNIQLPITHDSVFSWWARNHKVRE